MLGVTFITYRRSGNAYAHALMVKVYYSHRTNRLGMLRAVLSWEDGRDLLKEHLAHYAGKEFPTHGHGARADFAVLQVLETKMSDEWKPGFYRLDAEITKIEEAVCRCSAERSHSAAK